MAKLLYCLTYAVSSLNIMLRIILLISLVGSGLKRVEAHSENYSKNQLGCPKNIQDGICEEKKHQDLPKLRELPQLKTLPVKIQVIP